MNGLVQDFRYGARQLRKHGILTAVAVLTLALAIGANTAAFSVVRAVLLAPLPYADADRLVTVSSANDANGDTSFGVSGADFLDLRRDAKSLSSAALYSNLYV